MKEKPNEHRDIISRLQKEKPFEKIDGKKIHLIISKFREEYKEFSAQAVWFPFLFRYIVLNQDRLDDDPDEIAATIAHELGHHEQYSSLGTIEYFRTMFMLIFRKKEIRTTRREMEIYADKKAIEAGCAHGLYSHRIQHPKNDGEEEFYMTSEEIKDYATSIGKW